MLSIFGAVVEAGSFTAAAERLDVAKAKISISISRLEQQLSCSLFTRTTRKIVLTEAGRILHEQCQPLLQGLREALFQAGSDQTSYGELTGVLRISSTVNLTAQKLAPVIAAFALLHPRLRIDLRLADRIGDLVSDGIDLSFRMGWLRDSSQRAMKLGEFQQFMVAAPKYLKRYGEPKQLQDLRRHEWVALSLLPTPLTWKMTDIMGGVETVHVKSRLQVDALNALLALVQNGAGISVLDEFTAQTAIDAGKLVRLFPEWSLPVGGVYAVLPPGRLVPAKIRAFIDFYRNYI
ncbi:LysR family transcriptional regulator [Undibacterium sp. Dicai25W]